MKVARCSSERNPDGAEADTAVEQWRENGFGFDSNDRSIKYEASNRVHSFAHARESSRCAVAINSADDVNFNQLERGIWSARINAYEARPLIYPD